jgi:hypothetical protein
MRDVRFHERKIAILATAVTLSCTSFTQAQTDAVAFGAGVDAGPSIFIASGGRETLGGFLLVGQLHLDFFPSGEFAVGTTCFFYRTFESSERGFSLGAAYVHFNYFFTSTGWVSPYIGARIGLSTGASESFFGLGPQAGLKCFAARQFSINVELSGAVHPASGGTLVFSTLGLGVSFYLQ